MEWKNLNESPPKSKKGFVLGCDWYGNSARKDEARTMTCELPVIDAYWCGIRRGNALSVYNSICPMIGHGWNAHWMEIPGDNWIKFDHQEYPYRTSDYHEVLIKLKSGAVYTGFIEGWDWCPSFNMMKHGDLDDIDFYRELPELPAYMPKPALTNEELEAEKKWYEMFSPKP